MEKQFKQKGAIIAILDVEKNNIAEMRFVKGLGFKRAESYIWFSKNIEEQLRNLTHSW